VGLRIEEFEPVMEIDGRATGSFVAGVWDRPTVTDQDYGSRDFGVRDLEGNQWSFGTYEPV
jgi:uncharacterized glyoxalase superfamily protein PhnB